MIYQPIPDDERPGAGLVCNVCRVWVESTPRLDHVEFGTEADWFEAFGMCGRCGRDGGRCDGSCGCRCAHLHQPGMAPIIAIDGQAALDLELWPPIGT